MSAQSTSPSALTPGTQKPPIYFELEKTRDGFLVAEGQDDGQELNDRDKYRTAQEGLSSPEVNMPSKTSFGVLAKAKILEATGFFHTGKQFFSFTHCPTKKNDWKWAIVIKILGHRLKICILFLNNIN